MDTWIETAAGNLVRATSIVILVRRETASDKWEVCVSAAAAPAAFATGIADEAMARRIRNALAVKLSAPGAPFTSAVRYDPDAGSVALIDLEA